MNAVQSNCSECGVAEKAAYKMNGAKSSIKYAVEAIEMLWIHGCKVVVLGH